uniref:Reverse transcriptase domain-containing protein n=1 Tax=Candidatus Methanophaga sp. ANME-1 ERB7 TaxID=2759913 RepID=A0A7G9ZBW6_9EURY|nr:hypothetical protein GBAFDLPJ_00044 [Methanosarcinales archaeon ANME-1 ERB7]
MTTKLVSKTLKVLMAIALRAKGDPKCKFTSLAHLLTEDFLKECFRELKRGKSPGIDGVTVGEYAKALDENIADLVVRLKAKQSSTSLNQSCASIFRSQTARKDRSESPPSRTRLSRWR